MNSLLLFLEIIVVFSLVILAKKFFGKEGLYVWIGLATVLANIQLIKCVDIFGISATLGNVFFASTFLATDVISECYGKKEAKKGVFIGLFSVITYIIFSQITLLYEPNSFDIAHTSMKGLFELAPRTCIASVIMYFIANYTDVIIYDKLSRLFKGKKMWLRNNISTIICNCGENFGLFLLMFVGIMPLKEIIVMALFTSVIEMIIALCDTPFLYLSKKIN